MMKKFNLDQFVRGWFVGGFEPSLYKTQDVEVAIQHFSKGDKEASHCHRIATEITVVISGKALMKDLVLNAGDIVKIEPGEYTGFEALEDTVTAVVKLPGALNDKYLEK
ncbi:cupin domain-containing protein [Shewanella sp. 4t3-1-2LB]|uniref:cupin domain-containing protein n=1 Tax=Shewanella sp. 4t3-1-2LB TaxID=2817682 RepID=UPI001A98C90F|nr:cupin domain-containing protein [Shewanella sp. 4t3-1-2LB]MBO1273704.1 cupin domain-containing protein [Shewanella sp. 4t3-1-2LB]